MSPKLYIIRNTENGKFYNAKGGYFTELYISATYATSEQMAKDIINLRGLSNICEIIVVTEEEFTTEIAQTTVKHVIMMDSLKRSLDDLQYNLPTISGMNKNLGNFLKNTSNKLKEINQSMYDDFVKAKEDQTDDVQMYYEDFIFEVSKINLYECSELTAILKAFQKDRKSILGVAKKILK